ncbi:MAG: carboxypeptidase regulatory-like domain-containing protein [Blastocatellia bacterium]
MSLLLSLTAFAQSPVGTISGVVQDESGAVIPNANVTIRNKATASERKLTSDQSGTFSAPALPAGDYEIEATASGFRTLKKEVTVNTGTTLSVEMGMKVGATTEVVNVEGSGAAQLNYEQHSIDGVITRQKIQELPLNGRSFLQLAFLEPGVTASPGTTAQQNALFSVSILGGDSGRTAITVDGGNARNNIEGGTAINFSQEVIQEFQLSSTNFDLSTGITSVGAVNVVTRGGGNQFHGSGYFFFRDHNMAAYPALQRSALAPDPFFARRNPGFWVGGPIKKDRLFFFANYEYTNQSSLVTYQPTQIPSLASQVGNFSSPYTGHLFSTRFDLKVSDKTNGFLRYSHDQNRGYGPNGGAVPPSNWLQNKNFSDQAVMGVTSSFTPTVVNDFRINFTYWQNRNLFPDNNVCPNCLGLNFPQINVNGTNFTVGNTSNATQGRDLRRWTFLDTLTWQKGSHRLRFGTEFEYAPGTGFWGYCDPFCAGGFSPEFIRQTVPAAFVTALFPTLPSAIRTSADILNLPLAGASVGVGDPGQPPAFNIDKAKLNKRYRFYGQDTWKVKPNFTLNYGLAWNFESTLVNRDLDKPRYLAPLYGSDLSATNNNYNNFSPAVGFAWNPGKSDKMVFRGGAGIYWDTEQLWRRLEERGYIGPLGNGRTLVPHTAFVNTFPGIININTQQPVAVGAFLPASGQITNMTVGQFQQIYNAQIGAVRQRLTPSTLDLAVRGIQIGKTGTNLYPKEYPVQRSYHMNLGMQRDLGHDMVINVDFVRRVFVNTLIGSLDYNRFNRFINGVQSPVIPRCTTAAQVNDPNAQCSTGGISFWTPAGRQVYNGLLVKLDKRFTKKYLFTVSYALTDQKGINGVANLDNWFQTYGPQGARHILNVSGLVDLPWGFQLGLISAMSSRGPVMPGVSDIDLDGDGSGSTPIPGAPFNCFNRDCGKSFLEKLVGDWNATNAGKRDARGRVIPTLALPSSYSLGDWFSSQDVRLTKEFKWKDRYSIKVFGEMFNFLNVANLGGFNFNLANTPSFGQATSRAGQVFGSGGPRALQLGGRFTF